MAADLKYVVSLPAGGSLEERNAVLVGHKNVLSSVSVFEASKHAISPKGEVTKEALLASIKSLSSTSEGGDSVSFIMRKIRGFVAVDYGL
jgi:hypothetical protein